MTFNRATTTVTPLTYWAETSYVSAAKKEEGSATDRGACQALRQQILKDCADRDQKETALAMMWGVLDTDTGYEELISILSWVSRENEGRKTAAILTDPNNFPAL